MHSEYSSFDGLSKISEVNIKSADDNLVLTARKMGFPALALTDHGNIGGFIKFINACSAKKDKNGEDIPFPSIKPILGCEMYLCRNHKWKSKEKAVEADGHFQSDGKKGNRHLNLYALNWEGYQNLSTLCYDSYVDGLSFGNPRVDIEQVAAHSKGLMCGSACLSNVINANLLNDRYDEAKKAASVFKDIFGENFFLEIMYHGIAAQKYVIPDILKIASELDIPVAATNDVHYTHKRQAKSHEVWMASGTQRCLPDPKHLKFPYPEMYLKSAEEMGKIFGSTPQVMDNTLILSERVNTDEIKEHLFGGMRLPKFELPEGFDDPMKFLIHLAKVGMKRIGWDNSRPHVDALKKELQDIQVAKDNNDYDFATYFLIVNDYIQFARDQGIVVGAGRGSGYASILLRALGITYGPDPLEYGLLWERFLGFDSRRFILPKDFGFPEKITTEKIMAQMEVAEDSREIDNDLGGIDRY